MEHMEVELLPCPFCGGNASFTQDESAGGGGRMVWHVGCDTEGCDMLFCGHATKRQARETWNRRFKAGYSSAQQWRTGVPREAGWYLVTSQFENENIGVMSKPKVHDLYFMNGHWRDNEGPGQDYSTLKVLAYQPKPEPYQESKNEQR